MFFDILYNSSKIFIILRRTKRDMIKNDQKPYIGFHVTTRLFLSDFYEN